LTASVACTPKRFSGDNDNDNDNDNDDYDDEEDEEDEEDCHDEVTRGSGDHDLNDLQNVKTDDGNAMTSKSGHALEIRTLIFLGEPTGLPSGS
jgi:hypothetical protein